ncbi:Hsp20/alpha crystallin family protein [Sulfurimonas sp.]|uniref:Hsp20/alpha crystallin family protein n=1 Tax=Sulfurimonas sp. TaxID=2022749 RepID=UPI00262800D1|nr:Hsp20/alpha crystallin family protein [Sulfurimonas sp.]
MKKYLTAIALASLLTTVVSADVIDAKNPYNAEFAKMNQYFNTLVNEHFTNAKLNNFNYPRMDVKESAKEITLKFDLAGVPKKNIKLSIDANNLLTLKGEKSAAKDEKTKDVVKKEIFYGSFERAVQLPENVEQDKLTTSYKNGILTVIVPRKELQKPKAKVIPIQ